MFIKILNGTPIAMHSIKSFYKDNDNDFVIETEGDGDVYVIDEETYNFLSKMVLTDFATITSLIDMCVSLTKGMMPLMTTTMDEMFAMIKKTLAESKVELEDDLRPPTSDP